MPSNQLLKLCEQIEKNNLKLTVGLLRARAPGQIPLKLAVDTIKQYQAGYRAKEEEDITSPVASIGNSEPLSLAELTRRVEALESENKSLNQRIEALEKSR